MKPKTVATVVLLAFVAASFAYLAVRSSRRAAPAAGLQPAAAVAVAGAGETAAAGPGHRVVAYYFHGKVRCVSCTKIEALSREAIAAGFPEPLRDGRLAFLEVNVDDPRNRHFIDDFQLASQSLVIVEVRDGKVVRWKNLEKVWTLLDSKEAFVPYVREGVSAFLENV